MRLHQQIGMRLEAGYGSEGQQIVAELTGDPERCGQNHTGNVYGVTVLPAFLPYALLPCRPQPYNLAVVS